MDPRTAAHTLTQIADLLELQGANHYKSRAYRTAARSVLDVATDDLGPPLRSGELARTTGIGPATLGVIKELVETGESSYLAGLREDSPEGLLDMLRVPGLGIAKIHIIYKELGVGTLTELEESARDGRLASVKGFGPKTADKILKGISHLRETGTYVLYPHGLAEAVRLLASIESHPDVLHAAVAGSVRRRSEIVADVDIVAACRGEPAAVAASFTRAPGVRDTIGAGERSVSIRYVDGTRLDLHCVRPDEYAVACFRATGSTEHVRDVAAHASALGFTFSGDELHNSQGKIVSLADEQSLYRTLALQFVEPEMREGYGEVDAASRNALPALITGSDIRGVLHCHSNYSDGTSTIAQMAAAAKSRGWTYLGISDHSQSAFYAGGLTPDQVRAQHEEIDSVNAKLTGFRVLKGIEADILDDGRIDYEPELLDSFDYVIASVHSRFRMDEATMTARVLRALEDTHITILGHPTGRLLLTREPYAIDMEAVLEKARDMNVAVELNADPHRLDIDWTFCQRAKALGVTVEIGPDAHSTVSLDYMDLGIGIARKGWLEASDVLNTLPATDVLKRAKNRRVPRKRRSPARAGK
ncbi:MAG: DNA polymerase/3'-5' exonuclease PolX [Gemmatimonadaceae bacterium]|nr:DNA polymerase/3'-5' exonuclease PolX [Gemmatimonadaceae bacterium]MDQ3518463.1 DNA polymerase/3'-5' exonuclease PolX [Gemmatimonadota bacterium]